MRKTLSTKKKRQKEQLLSKVSKEVLIKYVLLANPVMLSRASDCLFSYAQTLTLRSLIFSGAKIENNKMHQISWSFMCNPKVHGGLGFKDLQSFNMALMAKQGWRILQHPNSLLSRVLKMKYFHATSFLQAQLDSTPFWSWQSILWGHQILLEGLHW